MAFVLLEGVLSRDHRFATGLETLSVSRQSVTRGHIDWIRYSSLKNTCFCTMVPYIHGSPIGVTT